MKSATAKAMLYGCLGVWMLAGIIGGATSTSDFAMKQTGAILCPHNTTSGATTSTQMIRDSNGRTHPSTAHLLQCKDANGTVVKEDSSGYSFLWAGIFIGSAIVLTAPMLLVVLIAMWLARIKNKTNNSRASIP